MVAPLVWGGLILGGIVGAGWAAREAEGAATATAGALKWATVAGGLYVSYKALKSAGALK